MLKMKHSNMITTIVYRLGEVLCAKPVKLDSDTISEFLTNPKTNINTLYGKEAQKSRLNRKVSQRLIAKLKKLTDMKAEVDTEAGQCGMKPNAKKEEKEVAPKANKPAVDEDKKPAVDEDKKPAVDEDKKPAAKRKRKPRVKRTAQQKGEKS